MNINRILYLIRNEWTIKWKLYTMILIGATLFSFVNFNSNGSLANWMTPSISTGTTIVNGSVVLTRPLAPFFDTQSQIYHLDFMGPFYVILGVVIISFLFWEYRPGSTSNFHISLPASQNEKWLAKFLFPIVLYPMAFFLAYHVYQNITHSMAFYSEGKHIIRMGIFDSYRWRQMLLGTLDLMTFFGLASIFRKYGFIKSVIVAVIGMKLISIIPNLIIAMYHPRILSQGFMGLLQSTDIFTNARISQSTVTITKQLDHWLYCGVWTVVPALASVLFSYFKFKEIEA